VLWPVGVAVAAALGALVLVQVVHRILLHLGRRQAFAVEVANRAHRPTQALVVLIMVYFAVRDTTEDAHWRDVFLHWVQLLAIASAAWLVSVLLRRSTSTSCVPIL